MARHPPLARAFGEGRLFRWIRRVSELAARAVARHVAAAIADAAIAIEVSADGAALRVRRRVFVR